MCVGERGRTNARGLCGSGHGIRRRHRARRTGIIAIYKARRILIKRKRLIKQKPSFDLTAQTVCRPKGIIQVVDDVPEDELRASVDAVTAEQRAQNTDA